MRGSKGIRLVSVIALAGVLVVSGVAFAHGKGRGGQGHGQGQGRNFDPEKMAARVELRVREELAPALGLDQKQTDAFVALVRDEMKARAEQHQAMRVEREALKSLVDGNAPEAELRKELDRMEAMHAANRPNGRLIAESKKILTVQQQAKLVLLLPKVMKAGRGGPDFDGERPMRGNRNRGE